MVGIFARWRAIRFKCFHGWKETFHLTYSDGSLDSLLASGAHVRIGILVIVAAILVVRHAAEIDIAFRKRAATLAASGPKEIAPLR